RLREELLVGPESEGALRPAPGGRPRGRQAGDDPLPRGARRSVPDPSRSCSLARGHPLLLRVLAGCGALPGIEFLSVDRRAGDLPQREGAPGNRPADSARPPPDRDGLSLPASPEVPGPAQRIVLC